MAYAYVTDIFHILKPRDFQMMKVPRFFLCIGKYLYVVESLRELRNILNTHVAKNSRYAIMLLKL